MASNSTPEDAFELYDLRVEVVCPPGQRIMCGAKEGDYFTLKGEMLYLPPDQGISIYSLCESRIICSFRNKSLIIWIASVLPLLPAKQRVTSKNDWMSTDALIACPDPCCPSQLKIIRVGIRTFRHSETTAVPLSSVDAS
ncbi:4fe-4s iron-sulfur binding protein [Colletotrichum incanum]|nr:4fe-4s iron-sulfur binding protein [Colletotrichum incanum]